jgi:hypothetical protein
VNGCFHALVVSRLDEACTQIWEAWGSGAQRRDPAIPPGYEAADFPEYCVLYQEAWSDAAMRWLLSVVPTIMIFDGETDLARP